MPSSLKWFLQRWLVNTIAVLLAAQIVRGITYDSFGGLLAASLVLGILNSFLRPLILLLSLPLLLSTLGLFMLFINAFLLYLVGAIVKPFRVDSFWAAFWGALIISIVSLVANTWLGTDKMKLTIRRSRPPPPPPDHDDHGPIIDV